MDFNGVDIYRCKFFTLTEDKKLKFNRGVHIGKTLDDYNTVPELQKISAYCYWIFRQDVPVETKYCAGAFLKSMAPKYVELEKKLRDIVIKGQKALTEKTEELTKTTGTKYI
jgi:hypothetical protein